MTHPTTDTDALAATLQQAAEAALAGESESFWDFANPQAVLALLAERETLLARLAEAERRATDAKVLEFQADEERKQVQAELVQANRALKLHREYSANMERELRQSRERAAADDALIAQQHVDAMTYRDERDEARQQLAAAEARAATYRNRALALVRHARLLRNSWRGADAEADEAVDEIISLRHERNRAAAAEADAAGLRGLLRDARYVIETMGSGLGLSVNGRVISTTVLLANIAAALTPAPTAASRDAGDAGTGGA